MIGGKNRCRRCDRRESVAHAVWQMYRFTTANADKGLQLFGCVVDRDEDKRFVDFRSSLLGDKVELLLFF